MMAFRTCKITGSDGMLSLNDKENECVLGTKGGFCFICLNGIPDQEASIHNVTLLFRHLKIDMKFALKSTGLFSKAPFFDPLLEIGKRADWKVMLCSTCAVSNLALSRPSQQTRMRIRKPEVEAIIKLIHSKLVDADQCGRMKERLAEADQRGSKLINVVEIIRGEVVSKCSELMTDG